MNLRDHALIRILIAFAVITILILGLVRFLLPVVLPGTIASAIGLLLLTAVLIAVVVWIFHREIASPFDELLGAIRRIAAGNFELNVRLSPNTSLNLQQLAEALNQMTSHYRETLAEAEATRNSLSGITSSMIDGLVVVDRDLRITLINPAAERLLGIDAESQGRHLLEVIRNYDLIQAVNETLREKSVTVKEIDLFAPNKRNLRAHATPITDERGKAIGVATILHDVTELKRLEQVRSDFVANVSHELRTPLTSIKGFIETLMDGGVDDPEMRRYFLQIISQETERMVRIVSDLLELSKLEAANPDALTERVDINQVIVHSLETCSPHAESKRIAFITDLADGLPAVPGDSSQLQQVFINLIDNAVKYTPNGGSVRVSTKCRQKQVIIEVSDTGIGIAQKHLSRIFERFYRVDKGRSREMGGTGLGLSIVKHIVEKHQGTISVESEVGEGTTFTIMLPAASVSDSSQSQDQKE